MVIIKQFRDLQSQAPLSGFIAKNARGKTLAIGVYGHWLSMQHQRYQNDKPLVARIERLTNTVAR